MPAKSTGRGRAQKLYPTLGVCEQCGVAPALDRHHVDGDPHNNARSNVRFLCRRCHMRLDGRTATEAARRRSRTHCPHGHEYTPENTYLNPRGARACRACTDLARRRYLDRKSTK